MRKHRLEIGEQRQVDSRSRQLSRIESCSYDGFVPEGRTKLHVSARTREHRPAGKKSSALRTDELHERDKNSVLRCDVAYEALPALKRSRSGSIIRSRNNPT